MKEINKETFDKPEVDVVEFQAEDVLTVSGGGDGVILPDDDIEP
jgi:hypothetical protein